MKTGFSRRAVLRGMGQSAALGSVAAALPRYLNAAEAAAAAAPPGAEVSYCLTTLYLSGDGAKFDADAFRDRHVLTLKGAYGDAMERVELRVSPKPPAPPEPAEGAPAPPPPPEPTFLAASTMWIADLTKFVAAIKAHGQEVGTDIASITAAKTIVQLDMVVKELGQTRSNVAVGTSCFSKYFQALDVPDKGPAKWDAYGYSQSFAPKVFAALGPEAVMRMEIEQGAAPVGGGNLRLLGGVHIYIVDEQKFETAATSEFFQQLAPEEAKYGDAVAYRTLMVVHAVG